jgi:hypothetical protein
MKPAPTIAFDADYDRQQCVLTYHGDPEALPVFHQRAHDCGCVSEVPGVYRHEITALGLLALLFAKAGYAVEDSDGRAVELLPCKKNTPPSVPAAEAPHAEHRTEGRPF